MKPYKNWYCSAIILLLFSACKTRKISNESDLKLNFLDEYIIPEHVDFTQKQVGGLSEIDFDGKYFYIISDRSSQPTLYKIAITISKQKIDSLEFIDEIAVKNNRNSAVYFDLEALLYNAEKGGFIVANEGKVKEEKTPGILKLDNEGKLLDSFVLPDYFTISSTRNNGIFEALARGFKKDGFWVANELPLRNDGKKPQFFKTRSPIRITYYKKEKPTKQFAYRLEPIQKIPFFPFSLNGLTAILEYKENKFITVERSFAAGRGKNSYSILLFETNATQATNTLALNSLKHTLNNDVIPAHKKLIFDFDKIKKQLIHKQIDNIEGICFGPTLENGNKTLLLIADNNFNSFMKQYNQLILLEIID